MFDLGNAYKNQLIDNFEENKYYSAPLKIDMKDKNNSKVIIAENVKERSKCLDVGCGAGYLGEVLKKYRDADVYGIDVDAEALKVAKKRGCFSKLYNFSVTNPEGKDYEKFKEDNKKFDCIIFADILEHVVDAREVIMFFSKYLTKDGKILISLPNVGHIDIIKGLINGKFNYNHIGLLDNTHLRFYTKSSFNEYIQQINEVYNQKFSLKEIGRTIAKPDYLKNYPNIYKLLNKNKQACVLQYIYELTVGGKASEPKDVECYAFDELEVKLDELRVIKRDFEYLKKRVEELEKGIDDIYHSPSWKLSKPIRGIPAVVRKMRRK